MKLREYGVLPKDLAFGKKPEIKEWRGKKNGCNVVIQKKSQNQQTVFVYKVEYPRGVYDAFLEDEKTSETLELAQEAAVNWINLYRSINSPILALSHYR